MDELSERNPLVLWSFWLACGLAFTGGIAPLLLTAGGPDRIGGAIIPFTVAAGAMGANALLYQRGRPLAAALYFLAGVATVYGMLAMFAVPLRLAVLGTCPALSAVCAPGLEREFSSGESTGFTVGVILGMLSILVGFFGLLILYRRRPKASVAPPMWRTPEPHLEPPTPQPEGALAAAPEVAVVAPDEIPATSVEAAGEETPAPTEPEREPVLFTPPPPDPTEGVAPPTAPEPEPVSFSPPPAVAAAGRAPRPRAAAKPRAKRAPKPQLELPPPESHLELPASSSPDDPSSDAPS